MAPKTRHTRRTQAERRAATTASLVEGTITALCELGYARTTAREICARAGVSLGALFGRFPTLTDLVLAAAREVARRQIDNFNQRFADLSDPEDLSAVLALLRASARDPVNAVWLELNVAARTDPDLRERLQPVSAEYSVAMLAASAQVPVLHRIPEHLRAATAAHAIHYFDGETISTTLHSDPEFDQQRMTLFVAMLDAYQHTVTRR